MEMVAGMMAGAAGGRGRRRMNYSTISS